MTTSEKIHDLFFQDLNMREKLKLNQFVVPYFLDSIKSEYLLLIDIINEMKDIVKTRGVQYSVDQNNFCEESGKKYSEIIGKTLVDGGIDRDVATSIANEIFTMFSALYFEYSICSLANYYESVRKSDKDQLCKDLEEILEYGNKVEARVDYSKS
jgi:hypothetical protein